MRWVVDFYNQRRAIVVGRRIALYRRGTEYVLVPLAIREKNGRELVEARNPGTGDVITLYLDELERLEVVP